MPIAARGSGRRRSTVFHATCRARRALKRSRALIGMGRANHFHRTTEGDLHLFVGATTSDRR
jgi:hypothetical protein